MTENNPPKGNNPPKENLLLKESSLKDIVSTFEIEEDDELSVLKIKIDDSSKPPEINIPTDLSKGKIQKGLVIGGVITGGALIGGPVGALMAIKLSTSVAALGALGILTGSGIGAKVGEIIWDKTSLSMNEGKETWYNKIPYIKNIENFLLKFKNTDNKENTDL